MSKRKGVKYDKGKPRLGLIPFDALRTVAHVFEFGAKKYGENNWKGGLEAYRLHDAALRHMGSLASGERLDKESGLPHAAHAVANMLMLLSLENEKK